METPFFFPWRARFSAMGRHVSLTRRQNLHQLETLFMPFLAPGLLSQTDEGSNSRERIYSLRRTFWGFLAQVLSPRCSCREIVRQIQALFALEDSGPVDEGTGGYCQARNRLPVDNLDQFKKGDLALADRGFAPTH
jgi:hypothetical protein